MQGITRSILLLLLFGVFAFCGTRSRLDFTPIVDVVAKEFPSVPQDIVERMIHGESGGNPDIVGQAGEVGLMQVLPATARFVSRQVFGRPESQDINLRDPEENIRLGMGYLSWLIDRYDGDIERAVAAYNCGHGCVDKLNGKPREHFFKKIPRSTKRYVSAILKLPVTPIKAIAKGIKRTVYPPKQAPSRILPFEPPPLLPTANLLPNSIPETLQSILQSVPIPAFNGRATVVVSLEKGKTVSHLALKYTGKAGNWSKDDISVFVQGQQIAKADYHRLPVGAEVVIGQGLLRAVATPSITVSA